jgi:glycosyltransferase involved in cell wall biosynthesis
MATELDARAAPIPEPGDARPQKIMIVTDAWAPQVNGVVRTLARLIDELRARGHDIHVVTPNDGYRTIPLITYPEIRLALFARGDLEDRFAAFAPDFVHIATEGSLGWGARALCLKRKFPFTTCYHTQYPEYVTARFPFVPLWAGYRVMRAFHDKSGVMLASTETMLETLQRRGFRNVALWRRGVDIDLFDPSHRDVDEGVYKDLPRPIFVCVGRVAVEKNLPAFLDLDLPGTKIVVGDGPARPDLEARYPDARFVGAKFGHELARHYADADVFVFPSLTETWGGVIVEAMASGTPVAGFDAPGPRDLIPGSGAGVVAADGDLRAACLNALACDRSACRAHAEQYSWAACAEDFLRHLAPAPSPK